MARWYSFLSILLTVFAADAYTPEFVIDTVSMVNNVMFGFDFFRNISQDQKNVFISPLSISAAMSQIFIAAKGQTRVELGMPGYFIVEDLHLGVPQVYHRLFNHLRSNGSEYTLEIANALITQADYPILTEYKQTLQRYYDSLVKEVDFVRDNAEAIRTVNGWVSEKTHGKITELVDTLDTATRLVLLNAVYFKGLWAKPFKTDKTVQQPFYYDGADNAVVAPMMTIKDNFPYLDNPHRRYKVLQLPYDGKNISMLIVLPYERDGVDRLKREMSNDIFKNFFTHFRKSEVNVTLPKFKFEYSRELKEDLERFGFKSLFGRDADLSGMTGSRNLYVDRVVHKAVIEVNEEGSEAAGVTGVVIVPVSIIVNPRVEQFHANHPFLFYIVDNRSKLILFMGSVDKP
ncbi:leukocyte elastase inhibitor-like isoform X2 [Centruroides sculpturatus]|uniref:leukocyte elastase inhibitor-like isoform X2 n=1 Tax=Centruroides sculpturatus TaxID=218467 RepID=UPI000C6D227F|nr:leukocyte elastase inhibitor-like isoform X2 [Centruroides sculpturatus]